MFYISKPAFKFKYNNTIESGMHLRNKSNCAHNGNNGVAICKINMKIDNSKVSTGQIQEW